MNDILLEVISTRGKMSLVEYGKAFDVLYSVLSPELDLKTSRRQVLNWLLDLGHIEFDFHNRYVYACKPSLVMLPGIGCKRAVLTGARVPEIYKNLRSIQENFKNDVLVLVTPQERKKIPLPFVITIEAIDNELIKRIADSINIPLLDTVPAAWLIANASGGLSDYEEHIEFEPYSCLNWSCRTFYPEDICFRWGDDKQRKPRLLEYTSPITQQKLYNWVNGNFYSKVDRDWGRYIALNHSCENVLLYGERKQLFAVPCSIPLPKLLSRALTLCSGFVAKDFTYTQVVTDIPPGQEMDVYVGVPAILADVITRKVNQRYIPYNSFKFNEEGGFYE